MSESTLAVSLSIGGFLISCLALFFSIYQARVARKVERIRVYDKVYHDASDLLLHHYKKVSEAPYVNDDKDLEKAVNEYASAHWLEKMYGFNVHAPDGATDDEREIFNRKVSEAYRAHHEAKLFGGLTEHQSPVFNLDDDEFSARFSRLMKHVTENLSFFSPVIVESWEKTRLLSPEKVKSDYIALRRVNEVSCEPLDENVDDPYLVILLSIRHEYRQLNKTFNTKLSEFWFRVSVLQYRLIRFFRKKSRFDL